MKKLFKKKNILLLLIFLILGGYFGYKNLVKKEGETRYALAAVEKGTLIVSVSGSGQVLSLDEADVKALVSGEILNLYITNGDEVKKGGLVAKLDDTDLKKAVVSAQLSLEAAQSDLDNLLSPPDELALFQAENALTKSYDSKTKAEEGIDNGLKDAFNSVTDIFFNLPAIITTASDALYGYDIAKSEIMISDCDWNETVYINSFESIDRDDLEIFVRDAEDDYKAAKIKYDQNLKDYKNTDYYAGSQTIENLLNETADTSKSISQAIKSEINLLDFVVDYFSSHNRRIYSGITAYRISLQSYYSKTNGYLQTLYSIQNSLKSDRQALVDAGLSVKEKELSLDKLKEVPDELTIRTKKLAIQQKEDTLNSAQKDLENSYISAPFDGVVSEVKSKKGDSVSKGQVIASIVTEQKIAEISLNEIDVAQVKVGQKATFTFDAVPDLALTGQVVDVDSIGAVSQGVVTYTVKIALDAQDERVKTAMSVSAAIITEAKPNVLLVPNSAVKSQGGISYVEIAEGEDKNIALVANASGAILKNSPRQQQVEIGAASDEFTEILNGIKEGDMIITRTIQSTSAQTAQTAQTQRNSSIRIPGINAGGGGFGR